jgi:hypothetical protein
MTSLPFLHFNSTSSSPSISHPKSNISHISKKITKQNSIKHLQRTSIISGHAQYAKGYAEETICNVTGSKEWQESGKKDTQTGIDEMKVLTPTPNQFQRKE